MRLEDAYKELGLEQNSSAEDAKKKYRELSKKYHPDINKEENATERFQKINQAYQCIQNGKGDEREDNFNDYENGSININDIFSGFGFNPFGNQRRQQQQIEHINLSTTISFKDSVFGCKQDLKYSRRAACSSCGGAGQVKLNNGCDKCGGRGTTTQQSRNMIFTTTCDKCKGRVNLETCKGCHAKGYQETETSVQVSVPGGVQNGNILRLQGMGHFVGNMMGQEQATDVFLHISVNQDSNFKLEGQDVIHILNISLLEAVQGCEKIVPTLLGTKKININKLSKNKDEIKIPNLGVNKQNSQRVILNVEYPDNIDNLISALKDK